MSKILLLLILNDDTAFFPSYSYFIKEGRVSEAGTHDQLIAKKGGYYEYVQLQALSKK